MPIGKLTRKIQCQSSESVRTPPSSTPMRRRPTATKPKMPIAFARSAGSVNSVIISESETADATAPPSPCTARAPTSSPCVVDRPQHERRQREERDPDQEQPPVTEEVAEPPAEEQEAAEGEQVRVHDPGERGLEKPRSSWIDGSATFTIVVSSTIIRLPRQRTISASQRRAAIQGHRVFLS